MDSQNDTIEVGPGHLKMSFSIASGQLKRMYNSKTGVYCLAFPVEVVLALKGRYKMDEIRLKKKNFTHLILLGW